MSVVKTNTIMSLTGETVNLQNQSGTKTIEVFNALQQGWIPLNDTFSYSSTNTVTVPGDLTSTLSVGQKIRLQQPSQPLTSYWTFDTNYSDSVGANNGTGINGPGIVTGKFGNCVSFNGAQAISLPNSSELQPIGDFTLGFWVNTTTIGYQIIFASCTWPSLFVLEGFIFGLDEYNHLQFHSDNGNTEAVFVVSKTALTTNVWYHVVLTVKNKWIQIYINGQLDGESYQISRMYGGGNSIYIGCAHLDSNNVGPFSGYIDDMFYIYNYALSEQNIREKYLSNSVQGNVATANTKHFFITLPPTYSAGTNLTTLTLYGGTDFYLDNTAISNVYFSMLKTPFNFNNNPNKWSVTLYNSHACVKTSPTAATWYGGALPFDNDATIYVSFPAGTWNISLTADIYATHTAAFDLQVALSSSNLSSGANIIKELSLSTSGNTIIQLTGTVSKILTFNADTDNYYVLLQSPQTIASIRLVNNAVPIKIQATCIYL